MRLPDNFFDDDDYRVSPWILGAAGVLVVFLALGTTGGLFFRNGSLTERATSAEPGAASWAERNDSFRTPIKPSANGAPAQAAPNSSLAQRTGDSASSAGSKGSGAGAGAQKVPSAQPSIGAGSSGLAGSGNSRGPAGSAGSAGSGAKPSRVLKPALASAGPVSAKTPEPTPVPTTPTPPALDAAAFVATASRDGSILLVGLVPTQRDRDRFADAFRNELPLGTRLVNQLQVDQTITLDNSALEIDGQARLLLFDALQSLAKTGIGDSKVTITSTFHLVRPSLLETSLNVLFAAEPIEFDKGSSVISEASYATIDSATAFLFRDKAGKIMLEGHTDNDGSPEANLALGAARAQAVRQALIDNGVSPARLEAVGRGQEQPIADNATDEGKQRNRRVEAVLIEEEPPTPLAETLD